MTTIGALPEVIDPAGLRRLPAAELPRLAQELRDLLISSVTRTGGHLGPNLGVVELTIAVHRVFESPRDAIVWDTGHQAYVHKMLTGRRHRFGSLRQEHGLSGYPNRAESPHDIVENSHASTALSYADGLAKAAQVQRTARAVVAVIGDGAMTGGLAWEALNNIGGAPDRPVVIVLNDNGRSYSPTVGALARHLAELRAGTARGNFFRDLGLAYLGPVDGHDIPALEHALESARSLAAPVVVHCVTRKGHGYEPAETDEADCLHAVPPAPHTPTGHLVHESSRVESPERTPATGVRSASGGPKWTDVVAQELVQLAHQRQDVVAITAAMMRPTGLFDLACACPERVFDVGIAEQHAVASAAGLATAGMHPVVAVYSTFLNRAFDQMLMAVALHRLPVTFVLDRSGVTGPDGPSHHGMWDVALTNLVPGVRVAAPRDGDQLRLLLREAVAHEQGPTAVRYPKGRAGDPIPAVAHLGGADVLARPPHQSPRHVLLLTVGPLAREALEAAELLRKTGVTATVVDPRWISELDEEVVRSAGAHDLVVTVEDNAISGGFGDLVARTLRTGRVAVPLVTLGLDDDFLGMGDRDALLDQQGLTADGIAEAARAGLERGRSDAALWRPASGL
jgi:1-deoxy-D-xylulose-5-phosphate synthase